MAKASYIKVNITPKEREVLEEMIQSGETANLSDALRTLAFAPRQGLADLALAEQALAEISGAHQELSRLMLGQMKNKTLYEPDLMRMERQLAEMSRQTARLSRTLRREV